MNKIKNGFIAFGSLSKKILQKLLTKTKESPKTIGAYITSIMGMLQLAVSQDHIAALVTIRPTTVGVSNQGIGMFLFAFILFGLVSIFAATRINSLKTAIFASFSNTVTIGFGIYYLMQISNKLAVIPSSANRVFTSKVYIYIGIVSYLIGIILYILDFKKFSQQEVIKHED